jgi:hypothetical protein
MVEYKNLATLRTNAHRSSKIPRRCAGTVRPGIRGLGEADEGVAATGALREGCDRKGAELSIGTK